MNLLRKLFVSYGSGALALCGLILLAGCETVAPPESTGPFAPKESEEQGTSEQIRVGEIISLEFLEINQKLDQMVQEDGNLTLILGQKVKAAGRKSSELQSDIVATYVPRFFRRLTVNIKRENRYYFVGGEVKNPSQRAYTGDLTVVRAIKAAGDFTEYADKKNVEIIRSNGRKQKVNFYKAIKDSKLDLPIYPGDTIHVPQSWK